MTFKNPGINGTVSLDGCIEAAEGMLKREVPVGEIRKASVMCKLAFGMQEGKEFLTNNELERVLSHLQQEDKKTANDSVLTTSQAIEYIASINGGIRFPESYFEEFISSVAGYKWSPIKDPNAITRSQLEQACKVGENSLARIKDKYLTETNRSYGALPVGGGIVSIPMFREIVEELED